MRRKIKKLDPKMSEKDFYNFVHSWFNGYYKYMSRKQRENIDKLYNEVKKLCIK